VFVDCSDEDSASVNVFLNLCRDIILLSNPDPFSLSEAYRKIIRLKKIAPEARLRIVINHAQSFEEGQALYKLLLKASEEYIKLDLNLLGIIRQDAHIREAVLNKELLLKRYPACNGTQDAALIAQQLLKDLG
jgi:flagellar biosynthesis protein FlhG